jgi:low temperature requirement protein LtrA
MASVLRGDNSRVGFVELFFDLVFVFAVTQVSHRMLHHLSWQGALETGLVFFAVWWVWIYTTWVMNRLDPEDMRVRGLLFAMMVAGLFLSMAIPEAFGSRGLVFAGAYVAMQLGRSLAMLAWGWADPLLRGSYIRISLWMVLSGVFWIGGALVSPEARLEIWALALAIEYLGPIVSFWVPGLGQDRSTNWAVRGAHMAERAGLFVIIALGETLLISGATFADMEWDAAGLLAFLACVLATIAMWWIYFHIGHQRGSHQIEHSADPGRIARIAFTYAHIPIVAGIVLSAVGAELAIAHPGHHAGLAEALVIASGTILFLLGNGWFKRLSARWFPLSHLVGLAGAVALGAVSPLLPLWGLTLATAALLSVVAVWEHRSLHGRADAAALS